MDSHRNVVDGFEEDFAEVDREIEEIGKQVEEDIQTPPPASRMSRERIEENFAHEEPEDKVTWGDDQPKEDVERPTVPRPGEWEQQSPEKRASAPEDVRSGQDETAEQEEETAHPSAYENYLRELARKELDNDLLAARALRFGLLSDRRSAAC